MQFLARAGLAVVGLALAAPVAVWADPPASSSNPHNHRRGLFGKQRLCAECQRAKLQAEGINIPPPPPLPGNAVATEGGVCTTCQASAGQVVMPAQGQGVIAEGAAPGYAVVGGDAAPGYAVVGGEAPTVDPSPIGMVQARPNQGPAAAPASAASADRSVMPASMAAPDPVKPNGSNRPHVLSHLFGLSAIGRDFREERERRRGQEHAAIRFDAQPQKVTELPASAVYDKRSGH